MTVVAEYETVEFLGIFLRQSMELKVERVLAKEWYLERLLCKVWDRLGRISVQIDTCANMYTIELCVYLI